MISFRMARKAVVAAAAGVAMLSLAGCAGEASDQSGSESYDVMYQLPWLPNVGSASTFLALENGYFEDEGVTLEMLDGGPTVSGAAVVASGKALIGVAGLDEIASAVSEGAELTVIGFQFQKNPGGIGSLAADPIDTPADLAGKTIGIPPANMVAWGAFLKLSDTDPSSINVVPVSDALPLLDGSIDGQTIYATYDPTQQPLVDAGFQYFLYDDYGYHMATSAYFVRTESLDDPDERAAVTAFMRAELKGWDAVVADPEEGARLAVETYGKDLGLDLEQQVRQAKEANKLASTPWTDDHGIGTISDELLSESFQTLKLSGIDADESLVDLSVIDEIYEGR